MANVTYEHVTKRWGDVIGVKDLNIEVADKEFLVFVGPSGCGKSTSLRMLAGLETISDGKIFIGDRVVNDVPPKDRDIAMVFQSYALYPHMTVYDNMAFGLKLRRTPKADIERRVKARALIQRLHHRLETTFIYVTHDQTEAMTMGSRIAVLKDGLLQQIDTPQRLYDHPDNMFVAGFIGSPSMNFFDVAVKGTPDGVEVEGDGFK